MVGRAIGEITHCEPLARTGERPVHGADDAVVPVRKRKRGAARAAALVLRTCRTALGRAGAQDDAGEEGEIRHQLFRLAGNEIGPERLRGANHAVLDETGLRLQHLVGEGELLHLDPRLDPPRAGEREHMVEPHAVVLNRVLPAPRGRAAPLRIGVEESAREDQLVHQVGLMQDERGHPVAGDEIERLEEARALPHAPSVHLEAAKRKGHGERSLCGHLRAPAVSPRRRKRLRPKARSRTGRTVRTPAAASVPQTICSSLLM